jgi:hypothetical protein
VNPGKTVSVSTDHPEGLTGEQLVAFDWSVSGTTFRFLVLKMPDGSVSLTEQRCLKRVASLARLGARSGRDWRKRGIDALTGLVERHGEARVLEVLKRG